MDRICKVDIPSEIEGTIQDHERRAAESLAAYFHSTVTFTVPTIGYRVKSSDVVVNGVAWEIKSPTGSSKSTTIQKQFKGLRQSRNLVIDGRRLKLDDTFALSRIRRELSFRKGVERVLYIQKSGDVIECKSKKR